MTLVSVLVVVAAVAALSAAVWWRRRRREQLLLEAHTIGPEELHGILISEQKLRVFDVRQPLDLLANSEIIPGSERVSPKEIIHDPTLIPMEEDTVVYCTCPGDETSRTILQKALSLGFARVRILKEGLGGWKAKGYPVERYEKSFHLDTPV